MHGIIAADASASQKATEARRRASLRRSSPRTRSSTSTSRRRRRCAWRTSELKLAYDLLYQLQATATRHKRSDEWKAKQAGSGQRAAGSERSERSAASSQ